ncbi:hypothetical protein [Cellulomonas sp. P5_C5]
MLARTLAAAAIMATLVLLPTAAYAGSDGSTSGTVTAAGHERPVGVGTTELLPSDGSAGRSSAALATDLLVESKDLTTEVASTGVPSRSFVVAGLAALVACTAVLVLVGRRDDDETEG